ncbi:hypothetical protein CORC01_11368 [Colletotrichum orchidophilum]|uniref:Uncharacterized protein n=1 Tax=Colletotrichum orchidophilum TaxID=1209926 RepID=A0A1G4AVU7_9PEZI|nr:uncharacterized protein CORC01_11368 [Colletotrichum orchidophilum]OHE93300.1 hypothetical protein CORC01_11368 [Colletotrichum orchidophilum]
MFTHQLWIHNRQILSRRGFRGQPKTSPDGPTFFWVDRSRIYPTMPCHPIQVVWTLLSTSHFLLACARPCCWPQPRPRPWSGSQPQPHKFSLARAHSSRPHVNGELRARSPSLGRMVGGE